jgi:CheY-like chemotaxis protein
MCNPLKGLHEMNEKEIRILLVEDDDGDYKMVERAFRKAKILNPLVRAYDGVEALDMLRGTNGKEKIPPPYLIFSDIGMPRMDGLTFVKSLREDPALRKTVVFMLTTSRHDEDRHAAYNLNVAGYILKESAGHSFLQLVDLIGGYVRIVEMPS